MADSWNERFTLNADLQSTDENPTDFMLFSDRFLEYYPTYKLDNMCRIRPGSATPTVNLAYLKTLLLDQDLSRDEELSWVSDKSLRFLDGSETLGS